MLLVNGVYRTRLCRVFAESCIIIFIFYFFTLKKKFVPDKNCLYDLSEERDAITKSIGLIETGHPFIRSKIMLVFVYKNQHNFTSDKRMPRFNQTNTLCNGIPFFG